MDKNQGILLAKVAEISVEQIKPDPEQPRRTFNEEAITNLMESMDQVGQLQPVIVRRQKDYYLLVVGERRWRAAKKRGQDKILARILQRDDQSFIRQVQLVENLQREDLNPVERAKAISNFLKTEGLSKKAAASRLGIPRTTLSEWLNVMEIEPRYQEEVVENFNNGNSPLTVSHVSLAIALVSKTGDPTKKNKFLDLILEHNLTRKETRRVVDLFSKHFNFSVDEAVKIVCLSRKQYKKIDDNDGNNRKSMGECGPGLKHFKKLVNLIDKANEHLEEVLDNTIDLPGEVDQKTIDDFLILHQLVKKFLYEFGGINPDVEPE